MENNILDEIKNEIEPPKFALKSYDQFWYSIICYSISPVIFELLQRVNMSDIKDISSSWGGMFFLASLFLGMIGFIINFFGIRNAYKSRNQSEVFTWKIFVGGFGNILLFFLWGIIIFYYISSFLDPFRF